LRISSNAALAATLRKHTLVPAIATSRRQLHASQSHTAARSPAAA
jgi:hypothetical protein